MGLVDIATKYLLPIADWIVPGLANRLKIDVAVSREKGRRPHPFSLWTGMGMGPPGRDEPAPAFNPSPYVSWPGLADRTYTGRHLPPAPAAFTENLPDIEQVVRRLLLREGPMVPCKKTSALFCFFAQWFTDSFLRTDPFDRRRNTSNHEIDFCQIYSLDEQGAWALRERSGGRMRLRENGLLPKLTLADGTIDPVNLGLPHLRPRGPGDDPAARHRAVLDRSLQGVADIPDRWLNMYAAGLDRGNSTIIYTSLSTMCVREHNRIAGLLAAANPGWDDDRLFETTRLVNLRNILAIVVEDYINHLAGDYDFKLAHEAAERRQWYRTNRITIEFNLLYRWHSLTPETLTIGGRTLGHQDYRFNNALVEKHGPEALINAASEQPAGRIQLRNTPKFLEHAEIAALKFAREFHLAPFTAYCDRFSNPRPASIAELTGGDEPLTAALTELYGDVDRIELTIGLLAQARSKANPDAVLPPLTRTMVAVDAFTHIFTNPLLAHEVDDRAFPGPLRDLITAPGGVTAMFARNSRAGGPVARPGFAVRPGGAG